MYNQMFTRNDLLNYLRQLHGVNPLIPYSSPTLAKLERMGVIPVYGRPGRTGARMYTDKQFDEVVRKIQRYYGSGGGD